MIERPVGNRISSPLLRRVRRHQSMTMLFRAAEPSSMGRESVNGATLAGPSGYVMATRVEDRPAVQPERGASTRAPALQPFAPVLTGETQSSEEPADTGQTTQAASPGAPSPDASPTARVRTALSQALSPIMRKLRAPVEDAPGRGAETTPSEESTLLPADTVIFPLSTTALASHLPGHADDIAGRYLEERETAQERPRARAEAQYALPPVQRAHQEDAPRVAPVHKQKATSSSATAQLPHETSHENAVTTGGLVQAGAAETDEYRPDWDRLSAIMRAHTRKDAATGPAAPDVGTQTNASSVQRTSTTATPRNQDSASSTESGSDAETFEDVPATSRAAPTATIRQPADHAEQPGASRSMNTTEKAQTTTIKNQGETDSVSAQLAADISTGVAPMAERRPDGAATAAGVTDTAAAAKNVTQTSGIAPENAGRPAQATQLPESATRAETTAAQRRSDMDVATTLQRVDPAQPTASAVHVIPPRRPRPPRRDQTAVETATAATSPSSTPATPRATPSMQQTDIGDLPVDLWALIDEEPPYFAADDSAADVSARRPLPTESEEPTGTSAVGSSGGVVQARRADDRKDPQNWGISAPYHGPALASAVTPSPATAQVVATPWTPHRTALHQPPAKSSASPPPASQEARATRPVSQRRAVDLATAVMRADSDVAVLPPSSGDETSDALTEAPPNTQAAGEVAGEDFDIEELARQVYTRLRRKLAIERERLG